MYGDHQATATDALATRCVNEGEAGEIWLMIDQFVSTAYRAQMMARSRPLNVVVYVVPIVTQWDQAVGRPLAQLSLSVVVEIFHRHLQTHCLLCPTVSGQPGRHHHTATAAATGREQWRHAFVLRRVRCNIAAPAADKDTAADAVLLSFSQNHRLVPQHDYEMDAY